MSTDTNEKGLENLIVAAMTGRPASQTGPTGPGVTEPTALYGGTGWILGDWRDYEREYCTNRDRVSV